jgi:hypothetical protein
MGNKVEEIIIYWINYFKIGFLRDLFFYCLSILSNG